MPSETEWLSQSHTVGAKWGSKAMVFDLFQISFAFLDLFQLEMTNII